MKKQKTWEEMTPAEKRVALANDVLSLLEKKKIVASDMYMGLILSDKRVIFDVYKVPVKENTDIIKNCNVCAKGALFVANVFRNNQCNFGQFYNFHGKRRGEIAKLFTVRQWNMIETAFEKKVIRDSNNSLVIEIDQNLTDLGRKCVDFAKGPRKQRMIAIMKNIIKNNGTFIP